MRLHLEVPMSDPRVGLPQEDLKGLPQEDLMKAILWKVLWQ